MIRRDADIRDLKQIQDLLHSVELPADDCADHLQNFFVFEEPAGIVAVGGLEVCGTFGLVRSIAVAPSHRSSGLAKQVIRFIEDRALSLNINQIYLLTESATEYFHRQGFTVLERSDIPDPIRQTRQYTELCPASAQVMFRKLDHSSRLAE